MRTIGEQRLPVKIHHVHAKDALEAAGLRE
jgi:hypothetical protein